MEIEAKFRIDDPLTFTHLLSLGAIGPFRLEVAPETEDQRNLYFDTADRRLRAGHYGLRVRDLGTRRIATLKGAARVTDGLYERDEWEIEIGDDDRPETWPASEVRDRVLTLLGGMALQPLLLISTQRRHIIAFREGRAVAEISLDAGAISVSGREEAFRELEIELLEAEARADFEELVALLRDQFPLAPEERSKLERGLALLDRVTGSSM